MARGQRSWCTSTGLVLGMIVASSPVSAAPVGKILGSIPSPGPCITGLTWDGRHLWLAAPHRRRLHRIDDDDGTTVDQHRTPSKEVGGIAFDGRYLWLTDREKNRLHVMSPASGDVLFSIKAPGPHPTGIAFDGRHIWVADYQTDRIYRIEHRGDHRPLRRARKRQEVEYSHQVRNLGPGKLLTADLYLAIPTDGLSQKLHEPVRFSPRPHHLLADQWGQRVAHFRFENIEAGRFATVVMRARHTL